MIEVKLSPIHGRGVFATQEIVAGQTFHFAHLLVFDCSQSAAVAQTAAAHYVFHLEDCPGDPSKEMTGIALSPISFVNHARPANASFVVDAKARTVAFTAVRSIASGEELTIDYGDFADRIGLPA